MIRISPVSIETLLTQADKNMYVEKQEKKKNTQLNWSSNPE